MTGAEQYATDVGLARHDTLTTNFLREDVLVAKTILKRHHDRLRTDDRRCRPDRLTRVIGFDEDDDEVRLDGHLGRGRAGSDLHNGFGTTFEHAKTAGVDCANMSLDRINQPDLGSPTRQRAADGRTQGPCSDEADPHPNASPSPFFAPVLFRACFGVRHRSRLPCIWICYDPYMHYYRM